MANLQLIDTTLRDGNQSLWGATALHTAMFLPIAPVMDRVGFKAIDFITSTHMGVAVRTYAENPWERIRLMRQAMPRTPLCFLTTGFRFISWETSHETFMRLVFRLLVKNGIRRFTIMDPMNDMHSVNEVARIMDSEGGINLVGAMVFTISPIHDDAFYADCAKVLATSPHLSGAYLKDPGGLLTPERARTLLPAIGKKLGKKKAFELHSHCNIGLAPFSYMEAVNHGVRTLHTAVNPAANGTSQPPAQGTVANLRALGHTVDLDDEALAEMTDYFVRLVAAEGLPPGTPREYDPSYLTHQMPGGMLTTMSRQLAEVGLGHLNDAVLEEITRVRAELGYPLMVTPFSQLVAAQALMNVVQPERYATVSDELIRYVQGRFGKPTQPVEPQVQDRILTSPRAQELEAERPKAELGELRRRIGAAMPDEEFVLRAVMPPELVDAMVAGEPRRYHYNPDTRPLLELLRGLTKRNGLNRIKIEKPGFHLELRRHAPPAGGAPAEPPVPGAP